MKLKRILSIILTLSIIATIFSSLVQIGAQTEVIASYQAVDMQTASRPAEPIYEFVIDNKEKFSVFMTTPVFWGSDYKIILSCDIDMEGMVFNPIKEFGGVFDGCGHTVSSLKIQNKSGKGKDGELALIKTLNEYAEIKNVTFDNYTIECKSDIKKAAGLIVTNHGTISSVDIVNGKINNIDKKAKSAGYVLNNEEEGVIENCSVGTNNKDANIKSGFVLTNTGKITKCSTKLCVNSKDIAGGFCGSNSGEINDCKAEGAVKASAKKGIAICGGFVGENSGIIKNSSSTGEVEGQEFTGGFAGINSEKGEISLCRATCDVKSHTYIASINCGGFVGVDAGKIEDSSFEGKVDGCVDSEKVVGIAVGVTVGVILTIAGTLILARANKHTTLLKKIRVNLNEKRKLINNSVEELMNNQIVRDYGSNIELNSIAQNVLSYGKELGDINYPEYLKIYPEYFRILVRYNDELDKFVTIMDNFSNSEYFLELKEQVGNIITEYKNNYFNYWQAYYRYRGGMNALCYFGEYNIFSSLIAVPIISFIGGAASGVATRSTAGSKCANIGSFCGFNIGEINKCGSNINSIKAKTLYNEYNMCGGFVGVNGKNGIIKDSNVTGNGINNKTYTGGYLGGFVGENSGKVENGTVNISVANGKYTGGFCGNNLGEIIGSKSEGSAAVDAKIVETKCGGFVGNNDKQGKIDGCASTGSVTGEEYVGGFCGDNTGNITKSRSEGNAIAKTVSNTNRCGGFVGENVGIVKDSTSTGSATGEEYVGGFCGDNTGEISKSRSEGNAKASTKANINRCGGFIGENSGVVKNSNSTGIAAGEDYVGGFAGLNKSEIIYCNAHGKATAKTKTHTALAGGFVGENEKGTITNCTATGGADSRSSSGQAKAGGFVGINKASIMSSKASGNVYLSAGTFYKDDGCGGFVGKNDQGGSIDGCYAESTVETTNKKKGGGFVGEAKSKSTIKNSQSKTKIVTKSGTKSNTKFCQDRDKKAIIQS